MRRLGAIEFSPTIWVAVAALALGFVLGRGLPLTETTAATQSQATPAVACLPSPAASPVALATPAVTGESLSYGDGWTIEVTDATKLPAIRDYAAEGVFVAVALRITNDTASGRFFPFDQLILLDEQERPFIVNGFITNQYANSAGIHHTFPPSLPTGTAVVFDVREDVGDSFVLQSTADPTFRVRIDLALRGTAEGVAGH